MVLLQGELISKATCRLLKFQKVNQSQKRTLSQAPEKHLSESFPKGQNVGFSDLKGLSLRQVLELEKENKNAEILLKYAEIRF